MPFMNRLIAVAAGALTSALVAVTVAQADHRPVIAVPGHPEVPAFVDGIDASYGVVIGEWGLYRAGQIAPKVIRPWGAPPAYYPGSFGAGAFYPGSTPSGYYPTTGRRPRYGRQEVEAPGERVQRPAESYRRSWSAGSPPVPATEYPQFEPPQVSVEPRPFRRRWQRDLHAPR